MNDQSIRQLVDRSLSLNIHSLVTSLTLEIIDCFTRDEASKAVLNAALIFHLETEELNVVEGLPDITAALANHHCAGLASEHILHEILVRSASNCILDSI